MGQDGNPYSPPAGDSAQVSLVPIAKQHRGPLIYFAVAGIIAAVVASPLIIPRSMDVKDDPNPIGYLLILISFPLGGVIYRLRSRNWPVDNTVRQRQIIACVATTLLPISVSLLTGMRGQGIDMTILSGFVSLILISGILVSGKRREQNTA